MVRAYRNQVVECFTKIPESPHQPDPSQPGVQLRPQHYEPPPVAAPPQMHPPQRQHLYPVQPDQPHL